jgi:hypothetical protein
VGQHLWEADHSRTLCRCELCQQQAACVQRVCDMYRLMQWHIQQSECVRLLTYKQLQQHEVECTHHSVHSIAQRANSTPVLCSDIVEILLASQKIVHTSVMRSCVHLLSAEASDKQSKLAASWGLHRAACTEHSKQ